MNKSSITSTDIFEPHLLPGFPSFDDLPWILPINKWNNDMLQLEEVQHGISRHPVIFIRYDEILYAIKALPHLLAQQEHEILSKIFATRVPCVEPVGYAFIQREAQQSSVLFTRFLETSVPYWLLFMNKTMEQYQNHLLDAVSGLMVQLHLNGFYWGDCSLSNILFRRDAGALQAYLVDAETAEYHVPHLSPMLRYHDLEIMEENISGELIDLQMSNNLSLDYPIETTGSYIQQSYRSLWEEITREEEFTQNERYRVEERVRAINNLGFSVKDIELKKEEHGNTLKLRVFVSDRNFHRNQLMEITGLQAEERQAQQILNEINELKAHLSHSNATTITLENAAEYWKENIYLPVAEKLQSVMNLKPQAGIKFDLIELYCQVLEHKWYLSERAKHDVGHQAATEDFIQQFA